MTQAVESAKAFLAANQHRVAATTTCTYLAALLDEIERLTAEVEKYKKFYSDKCSAYGEAADAYEKSADERDRLTAENERLVAILRKCMPGRYVVDLGDESICLHQQDDLQQRAQRENGK